MGILENAKDVANAVHEIKNLELYERVVNLHAGIVELVEDNQRLRNEKKDLEAKLHLQGEMKFSEPFYFREEDRTPYCAGCWESKMNPVHVVYQWQDGSITMWECPACKISYRIDTTRGRRTPGFYGGMGGPDEWMR